MPKYRAHFRTVAFATVEIDVPDGMTDPEESELSPPEDAFWAAQLDGIVEYADELYRETESGTVPAADDKQGD